MAQTNYTPISLYYSTTASAVPTAANLVQGELAINTADGKLYYEDSSGVVQVLATKSTGSIGGSNTQVQFNNSGSLGGSSGLTWDGSFLTTSSIKNSALTSGRVTYATTSGLLTDSANLTFDGNNLGLGVTPSAWSTGKAFETGVNGCGVWGSSGYTFYNAGYYYNSADKFSITGSYALYNLLSPVDGTFTWVTSSTTGTAGATATMQEKMRLTASGNLLVGITTARANAGDVQVSKGISFPATQSAQSDANTLDDYEEGTWTPSLGGNTTYNGQSGNYIKIGKMVYVEGNVNVNLIGTGSTSLVSGLPFTSATQATGARGGLFVNYFANTTNLVTYITMYINSAATSAQFQAIAAAGTTMSTTAIFGNSTDVYFSGCYYAAN